MVGGCPEPRIFRSILSTIGILPPSSQCPMVGLRDSPGVESPTCKLWRAKSSTQFSGQRCTTNNIHFPCVSIGRLYSGAGHGSWRLRLHTVESLAIICWVKHSVSLGACVWADTPSDTRLKMPSGPMPCAIVVIRCCLPRIKWLLIFDLLT